MSNIYRGTAAPLSQQSTAIYDPHSGYLNNLEYRGFSYTQALALANTWAASGASYSLTNQQGIATLVIQDASGNYVLDTWEIGIAQVIINSFRNPLNANKLLTLSSHDKAKFLEGIQKKTKWDSVFATMTDADKTTNQAVLIRAYDRFLEGDDSFQSDQYVVRHSTNVSNRYPYNIADTNKNFIYSPARFYSEVQNGALWLYPMPNSFVNVLTSNTPPNVPLNYRWGYLKGGSPRITVANNRTQIFTEYKQALWSTDEYESFV